MYFVNLTFFKHQQAEVLKLFVLNVWLLYVTTLNLQTQMMTKNET